MKKIDLHIHTVATISDADFEFSLEAFKAYVSATGLDAVAVTNHNTFDVVQYLAIEAALGVVTLPGIEIDVGNGHVLVMTRSSDVHDFSVKAEKVRQRITKVSDTLTIEELKEIYGDFGKYLVIPHTDKSPEMDVDALSYLRRFASAGEVDSQKKFIRALKDETKLSPVLFSDARISTDLTKFSARHTYVDCGSISIASLKSCLPDKAKVALSEKDGHSLWRARADGPMLSTGLNVLIGGRSSGKTHTLDAIHETFERSKYIRQFSLVQHSEEGYENEFRESVERRKSSLVDNYLLGLKRVLDEVTKIDLISDDRAIQKYVDTLLKAAEEVGRRDEFSKAALFDEVEFPAGDAAELEKLIASVRHVIENRAFRPIIEKHVDLNALRRLALELIETLWADALQRRKKDLVNGIVREVKQSLQIYTAAVQIKDVDLYESCMNLKRVERFSEIVSALKSESVILSESIQGFCVEATKGPFTGAGEIMKASNKRMAFSDAFAKYNEPYLYLRCLLEKGLPTADLHKLFVKISYRILNRHGSEVSGGERSEFRLLQEIADAQTYDVLLIDEPESSFDNLFLKSDVNKLIKAISASMPVVVVTHNSTVGASIGADYILHTVREIDKEGVVYRVYHGHPGDTTLSSPDGKVVSAHGVILDTLEAGPEAYEGRRRSYEAIKN